MFEENSEIETTVVPFKGQLTVMKLNWMTLFEIRAMILYHGILQAIQKCTKKIPSLFVILNIFFSSTLTSSYGFVFHFDIYWRKSARRISADTSCLRGPKFFGKGQKDCWQFLEIMLFILILFSHFPTSSSFTKWRV